MKTHWLNTEEAAEYLGYSKSTICGLCRSGELDYSQLRPGAEYRFRREWLDDLMESRRNVRKVKRPVLKPLKVVDVPGWDRIAEKKRRARLRREK